MLRAARRVVAAATVTTMITAFVAAWALQPGDAVNLVPTVPDAPLSSTAVTPPSWRAVPLAPTTVSVPSAPARTVRAGVAAVDATWKVGASAGQYATAVEDGPDAFVGDHAQDPHQLATRRVPSYGIESRSTARALVVEGTDGTRVALVSNDLYIAQDLLNQRVSTILKEHDAAAPAAERTGITDANMTISVSHSHSSPFYSAMAWGVWAFQDVFDLRFFEFTAQKMAQSVIEATAALRPVRMGATTVAYDHTQRHSFGPAVADDGTPAGYPKRDNDLTISVLRFDDITDRANPKPYAQFFTLGQHPEFLEGNNLLTNEFVGRALRMVDYATGGTTLFAQNNTGTSEPDRGGEAHAPRVRAEYSHREYAQAERAARTMANAVVTGLNAIGTNTPLRANTLVPYSLAFPVAMSDRQFAPPVSHPFPSVSNCRTHAAFDGNPGVPIIGLPDCNRDAGELFGPVVGELP